MNYTNSQLLELASISCSLLPTLSPSSFPSFLFALPTAAPPIDKNTCFGLYGFFCFFSLKYSGLFFLFKKYIYFTSNIWHIEVRIRPMHSSNLSHRSGNAGSVTLYASRELQGYFISVGNTLLLTFWFFNEADFYSPLQKMRIQSLPFFRPVLHTKESFPFPFSQGCYTAVSIRWFHVSSICF